jgi:hypothetical protein
MEAKEKYNELEYENDTNIVNYSKKIRKYGDGKKVEMCFRSDIK